MKKETILITGAGPNGVTGRRIKDVLQNKYNILSPSSRELNLAVAGEVDEYFKSNTIDYIIHCALYSPTIRNYEVRTANEVETNLRMYFNLARHSAEVKKMFYFGSGAEFDKSSPIVSAKEEEVSLRIPRDDYGFVKHILNNHAQQSRNIYNLRLFGTIDVLEPYNRNVVSNLCAKAALGLPLILNRDCDFSFIDLDDVIRFIEYGISNPLQHHSYNMVSGNYSIEDIAEIVKEISGTEADVQFKQSGKNNQYTGDNSRLKREFSDFTPIESSIQKVYGNISVYKDKIDASTLDSRWKA